MRCHRGFPAYSSLDPKPELLTLEQAAERLGICATTTRKLIDAGIIVANRVVPCAPWRIPPDSLEADAVKRAVHGIKTVGRAPRKRVDSNQRLMFPST